MSKEKLEQALRNWQEQLAEYELELSITYSSPQKFELRKRIQQCEEEIKRIEAKIKALEKDNEPSIAQLQTQPAPPSPAVAPQPEPTSGSENQAIEVFFSYAHEDEELRDELAKHLKLLERQKVISAWYDRDISAGDDWKQEIEQRLNSADVILLLISADFLASDFCWGVELKRAMERHETGEARVIPIILREVDWKGAPFGNLQALPKNAKPVTNWANRDQAFADIARGIRQVVKDSQIRLILKPIIDTCGKNKIQIAKAPTGEKLDYRRVWTCVHTLTDHSDKVNAVAINPDGQTLASGSADQTIKIWNLNNGRVLQTLSDHSDTVNTVAISPDGQTLASGSADQTIKIWNLKTGKRLRSLGRWFSGHLDAVNAVAISPDGQTLISGSRDHTIKLWNLETGKQVHSLSRHSWGVYSVAITPDGQTLASDSLDHTIKLCYLGTEELLQIFTGHSNWIWSIAISPDGQTLASGSQDHTIKLWNLDTGQLLHTLTEHSSPVHAVVFSFDGQTLASGSYDNTLKLWNVGSGELICTLTGHSKGINSVAFSPDGKTLVSGSDDKTIKIWQ